MVWKALKPLVHGFCTKLSLYETRSLYGTPLPPLPSFDLLYPLAFYSILPLFLLYCPTNGADASAAAAALSDSPPY